MSLKSLLSELGYSESPFFRESGDNFDLPMPHLLRDAQRAHVQGTYFIRTMGDDAGRRRDRPAVHVAEASSPDDARAIHRHLWNQGTTPFLLVSLPNQVRVYTPFAYDASDERVGQVERPLDTSLGLHYIVERLSFLRADSIDSGDIWRKKGSFLTKDTRVDRSLLKTLRILSGQLVSQHHLEREVAHALVGRFVYLHYLRERDILSDQWLAGVDINPESVFSPSVRLNAFRKLTDAVDDRFNGRIFPINWSNPLAPDAEAVRAAGRAFAGELNSGQMPLFRPFDFSFIPIELLSAIYEQFLHDEGRGAAQGAFYTSEPVADYLLAEVESVRPLERGVKVLDPCCGSGIFLVLAFRRLVEQELRRRGTNKLLPTELKKILTGSIFGVERNPEACLVTEFSLVLTLLSYVDPPELHRHPNFKFPDLHNEQIFEADFFSNDSAFWKTDRRFEWIVGNPPWVEHDPRDEDEQPLTSWIQANAETPVSRFRSGEAFTWRVRERLADNGVVGLVTQATSLTNDQSAGYRKAFFTENAVYRVTNFSNLAYILFESAEEPAANLIYSTSSLSKPKPDIVHFGPLVVNQPAMALDRTNRRKAPWILTIGESEIQVIAAEDAERGEATTWKRALWGNPRDHRMLKRLRQIFPTTLADIAERRGWSLTLGVQLRADEGRPNDPSQDVASIRLEQGATASEAERYALWFGGLKVLDPNQPKKAQKRLNVAGHWLVKNDWGTFIRKRGGTRGLKIAPAPHLLLWNEYAAYSNEDFIFRHPDIGLSAPSGDEDMLRAVSAIWTSSITSYCLFLDLSAGWGISRNTIDLGDVRAMPMPEMTSEQVHNLSSVHSQLSQEEPLLEDRQEWQRRLDDEVSSILSIPAQIMLLARELKEFRLPLVKGKAPLELTRAPDKPQLQKYASRLKLELDSFIERKQRRHSVTLLNSPVGLVATVQLHESGKQATATVRDADASETSDVRDILSAAEQQYGQWVYVTRSVRVFSGRKIHICKPARRLEWTETQAFLDAADMIAEVAESRGANA
ncbi:MAG: hypothetical protein QOG23_4251 [Blastocatellia bacterium]|jgi:hypothetical protein|nr:hypothetical protein [Blastocatellia bacterium]